MFVNLEQAKKLIEFNNTIAATQLWLDLGSGTGLFAMALAHYLPAGSKIIAVDKNENSLRKIPADINDVSIETITADFIHDHLDVKGVDGILMANSIYYVKDKEKFLRRIAPLLKANRWFLLVEYDRQRGNQWVPYPLTVNAAKDLFGKAGYSNFMVLDKIPSVYGEEIYAALVH